MSIARTLYRLRTNTRNATTPSENCRTHPSDVTSTHVMAGTPQLPPRVPCNASCAFTASHTRYESHTTATERTAQLLVAGLAMPQANGWHNRGTMMISLVLARQRDCTRQVSHKGLAPQLTESIDQNCNFPVALAYYCTHVNNTQSLAVNWCYGCRQTEGRAPYSCVHRVIRMCVCVCVARCRLCVSLCYRSS